MAGRQTPRPEPAWCERPLSPHGPLPKERENRIPSGDESERSEFRPARATVLPLLGERAVRGNGSHSNPTCRTIAGTVKLQESFGRAGGFNAGLRYQAKALGTFSGGPTRRS